MRMLNTNIAFVLAFVAIILCKINYALFGLRVLLISLVIFGGVLYWMRRILKKNGSLIDLPCLYPYPRPLVGGKIFTLTSSEVASSAVCGICRETNCTKHSEDLQILKKPWKNILVESHVNNELECFISTILEDNTSFLKDLSHNHEEILEEIRQLIRLLLSSLVHRIVQRLDLNEFLIRRIPKLIFHHFEVYLNGKRKARNARCLEEIVLQNYGSFLHPAILTTDNEIKFYKTLSSLLLDTTLPHNVLNCDVSSTFLNEFLASSLLAPLVDMLTDPDRINTLLIVLLDKESSLILDEFQEDKTKMVEFMAAFAPDMKARNSSAYLLGVEQKELLEDQKLLFLFHQYAKEEEFLNIVQFVINMKSFMADITNPELNDYDLKRIHDKLKYIHELFFIKSSDQFIKFDDGTQQFFDDIVHEYSSEVSLNNFKTQIPKLQSSKELYESFDYANNILEYHINKFYHTDIYLKLVCGQRKSGGFNFDSNVQFKHPNFEEEGGEDQDFQDNHFSFRNGNGEDNGHESSLGFMKSLSDYEVNIVDVNSRDHPLEGEIFLFVIQIKDGQRAWTVERQLQDFQSLLSKLKLFHGDSVLNSISPLPNRKPFQASNRTLMETFRYDLELFLRSILRHKSLQRSELIYNFLSVDFQTLLSSDNFNLGKIIKNVPSKFTKERGQHLQTFIKNFIASCEEIPPSKPKERTESFSKPKVKACDSLNLSTDSSLFSAQLAERSSVQMEYLYDFILLLIMRFYRISKSWLLEILLMLRPLVRKSFQAFAEYQLFAYLEDNIFTPERICHYIRSFRILYREEDVSETQNPNDSMKTILEMSKSQRSQKALEMAKDYVPRWMIAYFAEDEKHDEVIFLLFSLLQYRSLNKQLLFLILNSIISDLFPEELIKQVLNKATDK